MVLKVPEEVASTIKQLDKLQFEVFDKLDSIVDIQVSQGTENVTIELVRSQISKEVTGMIAQFKELAMILGIQSKNYPRREDLAVYVEIYQGKLASLKNQLREAQIKSYTLEEEMIHKQRIEKFGIVPERSKSIKEMRQDLFSGRSVDEEKQYQEGKVEDQILDHNKSITTSLQSTRQLMTTTIMQTDLNIDSLDQQTKNLSTFDTLLNELESTLKKSKNIVKFIEKQDRMDKNRIYMSIGFFLVCCLWVIWRRILKTPVKIVLWSLFKVFRIVLWFFPSSKEKHIIESVVSSSTALAAMTATMAAIASSTTKITESADIVEDKENPSEIKTWEEVVEQFVKDEL